MDSLISRAAALEKAVWVDGCFSKMVSTYDLLKLPSASLFTPCDLCAYAPPSSGDGKPCSLCPAKGKVG